MRETRVASFPELHEALAKYRKDTSWAFRGQQDPQWSLVPKAGRVPYSRVDDLCALADWKRRAIELVSFRVANDWDWLTIAQHHRLPTRLLDWSFNPLVAAFFAAEHGGESDCVVYAHRTRNDIEFENVDPASCEGVQRVKARAVANRLTRQLGLFTIHCPPSLPLETNLQDGDQLERIVIDGAYRGELIFELSHYGVNRLGLFPDLDGLSDFMNWFGENSDSFADP